MDERRAERSGVRREPPVGHVPVSVGVCAVRVVVVVVPDIVEPGVPDGLFRLRVVLRGRVSGLEPGPVHGRLLLRLHVDGVCDRGASVDGLCGCDELGASVCREPRHEPGVGRVGGQLAGRL